MQDRETKYSSDNPPFHIAVVNSHPIQYFAPLYAYLNSQPDLKITALYLSDHGVREAFDQGFGEAVRWDVDLLDGYDFEFIGRAQGRELGGAGFLGMTDPAIWSHVRAGGFDALWTHGHAYGSNLIAMAAARSRSIPVFLRGETSLLLRRSGWRKALRHLYHKSVFASVDQFLAIGDANRDYYLSMGVAASRIHQVPYVVDNDRFIRDSRISDDERRAIRAEFGVKDDTPIILYLSKLQRRKHPEFLVEAADQLNRLGHSAHAVIVGSGEMDEELRALVAERALSNVHFAGFQNQARLPKIFAASDIFVLPAKQEPYGLVVNEAMCAGLPIVTTDEVGASRDLVHDGRNGSVVPAGEVQPFVDALAHLVSDGERRLRYGAESLRIIQDRSFASCLRGVRSAVQAVRERAVTHA